METDTNFSMPNIAPDERALFSPISTKEWLITLLLMAIPLVNFIIMIVWVVSDEVHPTKRNFAKAYLLISAISLVIMGILFTLVFGTFISTMMGW